MKIWQVYGEGEGFVINGKERAFELSGFVEAEDANAAFSRACELAIKDHPALAMAAGQFPRPIINPQEVQEVAAVSAVEVGKSRWTGSKVERPNSAISGPSSLSHNEAIRRACALTILRSTSALPRRLSSAEADMDTPVKRFRPATDSAAHLCFLRRLAKRPTAAGGLLTLCLGNVWSQSSGGQEIASEGKTDKIEYVSVAAAMRALKQKPGASTTLTQPDGWTIIKEPRPTYTQWSFAPAGHYAHPAVVRRAIKVADNGDVSMETTALCEAPQLACEKLMSEFQQLNARAKQSVQQRLRDPAPR